jgi:CHAT domain-containing protein
MSNRRNTKAFISAACLYASLLFAACHQRSAGSTAKQLFPAAPIKASILGEDVHEYSLPLDANQYCRIALNAHGAELNLVLYDSAHRKVVDVGSLGEMPTRISIVASVLGPYLLEIRFPKEKKTAVIYTIELEESRPAAKGDEKRILADKLFAEGMRLQAVRLPDSERNAVEKYKASLSIWGELGEKREEAFSLLAIAGAYHQAGDLHQSLAYYSGAKDRSRAAQDYWLEVKILNALGRLHVYQGKNQEALKASEDALKLSQEHGFKREEAESLDNLGEADAELGNRPKALDYHYRASSLWQSLHDTRGQAQNQLYIGYRHYELSNVQTAFEHFDRSLRLWQEVGDRQGQALTLVTIGHLCSLVGEKQRALELYREALPALTTSGDLYRLPSLFNGLGYTYQSLGDNTRALDYYSQSMETNRKLGLPRGEAIALIQIGDVHRSSRRFPDAVESYQKALEISRQLNLPLIESYALKNIGSVQAARRRYQEALSYHNLALSLYTKNSVESGKAYVFNEMGNIHLTLGQPRQALGYFTSALQLTQVTQNLFEQSRTRYNLARAEMIRGNFSQALAQINHAFDIIESLRANVSSPTLRASYFASIQEYYEFYIELLMDQHNKIPNSGFGIRAFEASERARARGLLDQLTQARADFLRWGDPALIEEMRSLQRQMDAKMEEKRRQSEGGATEEALMPLSRDLAALIIEREQVEAQIRKRAPQNATQMLPQPSSVKEIQELLDENTLLLEYSLGAGHGYLWAVAPNEVVSYRLQGSAEIEKAARKAYELLSVGRLQIGAVRKQTEEKYWRAASILSQMLLGDVAAKLNSKRLLIVADGILQYIPFQALPVPRANQRPASGGEAVAPAPLMLRHEIVNLPSASTLVLLRRELSKRAAAPKAIAVVADPVFESDDARFIKPKDKMAAQIASNRSSSGAGAVEQTRDGQGLSRLYSTIGEAEAIKAVTDPRDRLELIGFAATRAAALNAELGQYRIIHFATHGDLDSEHPELSSIVLSLFNQQGQRQEGRLRFHDIYNMNLPAELVVLSACETALGKEIKGEGLVGLTRGFMYAGAARVMASLWKVSDRSTAELMKHFYRFHLKDGMSPAAALRQAQIEMWKQDEWRAPYHWAGFLLQGEYK